MWNQANSWVFAKNGPLTIESKDPLIISTAPIDTPFEEKSEPTHPARKFLDYLGFKKDGEGWKDKHDCFIYDNKVPSELKDLVAIQNGTAHNRGFQKGKLVCKEVKEGK